MKGLVLTLLLSVVSTAMASDKVVSSSHCSSIENGYSTTTTQCDDGTVTVTSGSSVIVCRKDHDCQRVEL